mgnify:CR=1 FL=1
MKLINSQNKRIFNLVPRVIIFLLLTIIIIDLTFLIVGNELRYLAVKYFGFWPNIVNKENSELYKGQEILMFASYFFLHNDLSHMALNAAALLALGCYISESEGQTNVAVVFFTSVLSGALLYLALGFSDTPVIGSSGAVFGCLGFWKGKEFLFRRKARLRILPVVQFVLILSLIDIILNFILGGILAWEVHLGGFISGWFLATVKYFRFRS